MFKNFRQGAPNCGLYLDKSVHSDCSASSRVFSEKGALSFFLFVRFPPRRGCLTDACAEKKELRVFYLYGPVALAFDPFDSGILSVPLSSMSVK